MKVKINKRKEKEKTSVVREEERKNKQVKRNKQIKRMLQYIKTGKYCSLNSYCLGELRPSNLEKEMFQEEFRAPSST